MKEFKFLLFLLIGSLPEEALKSDVYMEVSPFNGNLLSFYRTPCHKIILFPDTLFGGGVFAPLMTATWQDFYIFCLIIELELLGADDNRF